jgi:phosphate starvation-inducible protein PhoH and related proteins
MQTQEMKMIESPKSKRASKYKGAVEEGAAKVVSLQALNDNQRDYIKALNGSDQVIVCGFSGTGKTYIAATYAANMYASKEINKIILTRPTVSVGERLGFFPGTLEEKIAPWAIPVLDVLNDQLGKGVVETGLKNGNIEMAPLSTMRGRSFHNAFIILDEAQNTTIAEIKMFLTRVGKGCKVVLNGDIKQSDITTQSGLSKIIHLAKKHNMPVPVIEFGVEDIVRSDICKQWIIAFEEEKL